MRSASVRASLRTAARAISRAISRASPRTVSRTISRIVAASVVALASGAVALWGVSAWDGAHADVSALSAARAADAVSPADLRARGRVVLVTLDGARWQDVLHQGRTLSRTPVMPRTMAAALANGAVRAQRTSSLVPLSLPGYLAIYTGRTTPCRNNACGPTNEETLIDALGADAAVFASWSKLQYAFRAGTGAHIDAPLRPPGLANDVELAHRADRETIAAALAYFAEHHPRFFHLALLEMDTFGHANDAPALVASLRQADDAIAALLDEIARMPPEERRLTTLIVTADHGRGPGALWQHHSRFAAARNTFVIAVGDLVGPTWSAPTQADLRPAIEQWLGR